jgi:hypothetical protein
LNKNSAAQSELLARRQKRTSLVLPDTIPSTSSELKAKGEKETEEVVRMRAKPPLPRQESGSKEEKSARRLSATTTTSMEERTARQRRSLIIGNEALALRLSPSTLHTLLGSSFPNTI